MKIKEIINDLNGNTRRRFRTRAAVGTSIGVLVGAATGMLLAPKSGKEIRKDIKHGAEWSAEKARVAAHKTAEFVRKEAATASETAAAKLNDFKEQLKREKEDQKYPKYTSEKPEGENKF